MDYDVIIVGGGIGGSTLAKTLAEKQINTLVIEKESVFRDRVRGEGMHPWGITEARQLGIYELLCRTCAHEVRWWNIYSNTAELRTRRDLIGSCRHRSGSLNFCHVDMQEVLLQAAQQAGATVWRGATVVDVTTGDQPQVTVRRNAELATLHGRLIVCADGRNSQVRLKAGFHVNHDPKRLAIAGLLFENLQSSADSIHHFYSPAAPGRLAIIFPLTRRRYRVYYGYNQASGLLKLSGRQNIPVFVAACQAAGVPDAWFAGSTPVGPLAMFQGAAAWVDFPYREGVVLIGDAAATSDPTYGCGLSLTLRDVRVLSEHLLGDSDWRLAAQNYAREHNDYYGKLHRKEAWLTQLLFELGPEADALRAHAFPLHAKEPDRNIDIIGIGPDYRYDETARRRYFGEDLL